MTLSLRLPTMEVLNRSGLRGIAECLGYPRLGSTGGLSVPLFLVGLCPKRQSKEMSYEKNAS